MVGSPFLLQTSPFLNFFAHYAGYENAYDYCAYVVGHMAARTRLGDKRLAQIRTWKWDNGEMFNKYKSWDKGKMAQNETDFTSYDRLRYSEFVDSE